MNIRNFLLYKKGSAFFNFSVNTWIIFVNIFLFFIFYFLFNLGILDFEKIAITPSNIFQGKYLWTFLTSIFMHANFVHLFANMFSLFFVGKFLEKIIGRKRYLWFYIISGIFAGLFFSILSFYFGNSLIGQKIFGNPNISAVGASGAIFGLLGVLAILIPYASIYLILGPLILIIIQAVIIPFIPENMVLFISILFNFLIFIMIFAMFSFNSSVQKIAIPVRLPMWLLPIIAIVPLVLIGLFIELPIGNTAHLGGLIAGLIYGGYLKYKFKNKVKSLRKYFS